MERASYLGAVRLSDQVVLASVFTSSVPSSQKATIERLLLETVQGRGGNMTDRWKERLTIGVLPGDLYLYVEQKVIFGSWIKQGASDTAIWTLMKDAAVLFSNCSGKCGNGSLAMQGELKKPYRQLLNTFCSEKNSVDRAQGKVDEAAAMMQENMRKLIENQKGLESLEENSAKMNRTASLYQMNARSLRRNMEMRMLRLRAMIAFVVLLVISYIVYQFT